MNNADLVWRLVEVILQQEKDLHQAALEQVKAESKPDEKNKKRLR